MSDDDVRDYFWLAIATIHVKYEIPSDQLPGPIPSWALSAVRGVSEMNQQEAQKMKILEALAVVSEASSEIASAVSELRAAVEALGLSEDQSGDVMAALEMIEELIAPMEDETPATEEPESAMDTEETPAESLPVAEALSESLSSQIEIVEAETPASPRDPLAIRMRLIKAGPGNPQDKHYYPGEVLKRDAHVFEGVKMYTVDHNEADRSERTEVAKIRSIVDYEEDGSPIGDVIIFDPAFAEKTRNRAKAGQLDSLECSILAKGTAKEGDVDGQKYNVVEAIESAQAVDFVTRAGAGGQALSIAESETGAPDLPKPPEPEPKPLLEKERVLTVLRETSLPKPSQERLAGGEYADESALHEAVLKETAYIKEISGSGTPLGAGPSSPAAPEPETAEQRRQRDAAWYSELRERCGLSAQ